MTQPLLLSQAVLDETRPWPEANRTHLVSILGSLTRDNAPQQVASAPLPASPDFALARVNKDNLLLFRRRRDGAIEAHEVLPTSPTLAANAPVAAEAAALLSPLSYCSRDQLLAWGVPKNRLKEVRLVRTHAELAALALPPDVTERLTTQLAAGTQALATSIPAFLQYRVDSVEMLQQWYQGNLTRLLLNLSPDQELIVKLNANGPVLVNGVAGSGKTTVALYRMKHLAETTRELLSPRILYLTYNKSLRDGAKQLLLGLGVNVTMFEVCNIHQWCKKLLGTRWSVPIDSQPRQQLLTNAIAEVRSTGATGRVLDAALDFWEDEIGKVIKGRSIPTLNAYMEAERVGTGRALQGPMREVVWKVYEAYERLKGNRVDWDDIIPAAFKGVISDAGFQPYTHVFVDEAQDLPPMAMRLALRLAGGDRGSLLITTDPSQSIYQKGFAWRHTGIEVVGRSYSLAKNHRSTDQILAAATPLLSAVQGQGAAVVSPQSSNRVGPKPRLVAFDDWQHQLKWVTAEIKSLIVQGGVPASNIAVLARRQKLVKDVCHELQNTAVPVAYYQDQVNLDDPTVKAITIHSAKGLEFPVVFVVGVDQSQFYRDWSNIPEDDRAEVLHQERKLLYVAMTRAMQDLTITYTETAPAKDLIDLLSSKHIERTRIDGVAAPHAAPQAGAGGLEIIDRRNHQGRLWVIGGPELEHAIGQLYPDLHFRFAANGGRATGHRPAWWAN